MTTPSPTEREKFDKWCAKDNPKYRLTDDGMSNRRDWLVWQAALSVVALQPQSQAVQAVPVAWLVTFEDGSEELHFADTKETLGETQVALYASVQPVQPQAQAVQAVPLTDTQIEAIGHRKAWRYKKSSDPHHSDTYTFNRHTLVEFARAIEAAHKIVAPAPSSDDASGKIKTGFCKLKAQPGGCPMDNLQCGWPDCEGE